MKIGVDHRIVLVIFLEDGLYPYNYTGIHNFLPESRRIEFCKFISQLERNNVNVLQNILWTDETFFTREGVLIDGLTREYAFGDVCCKSLYTWWNVTFAISGHESLDNNKYLAGKMKSGFVRKHHGTNKFIIVFNYSLHTYAEISSCTLSSGFRACNNCSRKLGAVVDTMVASVLATVMVVVLTELALFTVRIAKALLFHLLPTLMVKKKLNHFYYNNRVKILQSGIRFRN
ncbi:hypothetical protein ANN_10267 [Periplaneta americana]|uniref:PiggyBac transposable element-derived protein domain-containing protein n=1 Tax=Periplaneta americana TaxID=6978 RepID=A0ABQ8TPL9_PERAM|nr:hypothetical protein ANN_10267 [Periplaneta americana]